MTSLTPKQRKTFAKITEVLVNHPDGASIQDLYNEARLSITVIKNALAKMNNVEQRSDLWFLKDKQPVQDGGVNMQETAENLQDNAENMQDSDDNYQANLPSYPANHQAPYVSYPDNDGATLINTPAPLVNPTAEIVNPSGTNTDADQSNNGQAINTTSQGLAAELKQLDNAHLDGLISKTDAQNAEVSQANRPEFFGGDKVYVLNAGSPYIHKIDWVENNQLGTVHFKDSMDSRSQKWLLPATKENHAKLRALMPWIEWQHPELVGSDLMLKILEDDEVWLCRVGNDGDENCSFEDIRLVIGQHDEQGFFVAGRGDIAFKNSVPVNVHGAPLTESDVFGAA